MRKFLRYSLYVLPLLASLAAIGGIVLYRAAKHEPDFYRQALVMQPEAQESAGDDLERSVLNLHNDVQDVGRWDAVFTEGQINGWLASDLLEKFPHTLPYGTGDPRVAIEDDLIRVACRYDNGKLQTIVSFALSVRLTTETNTLAVKISQLRAGALPVPLKHFLDHIEEAAQYSRINLRWTAEEGEPIALVEIPVAHEDYAHQEIYIDTVQISTGEIYLAGHTQRPEVEQVAMHASLSQSALNETVHR